MPWFKRASQTAATPSKVLNEATYLPLATMVGYRHDAKQLALSKQASVHSKQPSGHRTKLRGRGIDFDEVRRYQPGDDIRTMSWRIMAKTGKPYTKLFHDERERPVIVWVDYHPSMFFATRKAFKSVVASHIAALLAWSAFHHGDRLGGLAFAHQQHWEIRPRRHQNTVLNFLSVLDEAQRSVPWQTSASASTSIDQSLIRLRRITRSGSLIFLLSDFHARSSTTQTHLERLSRHNDLVLFHLFDPIEAALPPPGHFRVSDGQQQILIDAHNPSNRRRYAAAHIAHTQAIKAMCWQGGMRFVPVSTTQNVMTMLQRCQACSPFINLR